MNVETPPPSRRGTRFGALVWVFAVAGPVAVSGALIPFRHEFGTANAALVLVLVVFAAGTVGGRQGGVVSAGVAALCFDFFFTRPYYSLAINSRDDIETTVVLLIIGVAVGELVVRERRSRRMAEVKGRQVDQIRRVAELGAGTPPKSRLVDVVQREVIDLLGGVSARFEPSPFPTTLPRLDHERLTVLASGGGGVPPPGPRNELELQVWGRGRMVGRLVVVLSSDATHVTRIASEDRALAVALADQLGAVLAAGTEGR